MIYETFDCEVHDVFKVAGLIYDVDFRTFDMLFKTKQKAVDAIAKDLAKDKSGELFMVILDDDSNILGIVNAYTSSTPHKFYFKSIRLLIVDILDHFVLSDICDGDFYIADFAIDSALRGQGLGRKVLLEIIDYALSKGYKRVILDADFRNDGAKNLYERVGFKVFNKKSLKIGNFERGMYNMEFKL